MTSLIFVVHDKIENEYGIVEDHYGEPGKRYMHWAAEMALSLDTGVPWIMCKQSDAPDPIVSLHIVYSGLS